MKKTEINLQKNWTLTYDGKTIPAEVPGDITLDLYRAGQIEDPYYGMNHKSLNWIIGSDFTYGNVFDLSGEVLNSEEILLEFDSIDTFAEVYLNDTLLGKCENMFLKYVFSVKNVARAEGNRLVVKMHSTTEKMQKIDDSGYFGVFNTKRLFIRKAQCHFGWDWAPDMPGYGICGGVRIKGVRKNRLQCTNYKAFNDGFLSIFAELNYTIRPQMDFQGNTVKVMNEDCRGDVLRYTVASEANKPLEEAETETGESKICGKKNFMNFRIPEPKLWYPSGMGEQPLYTYKVELIHNGEVVDEAEGRFAFREVRLVQKPTGRDTTGYKFVINGKEVFIKGSNWVPAECFIGCIRNEKYENLIDKAAKANFNMLRVWGGGLYEKDVFYDLCDEKGVMVWQDLMFACADIPEDDEAFVANVKKEITIR